MTWWCFICLMFLYIYMYIVRSAGNFASCIRLFRISFCMRFIVRRSIFPAILFIASAWQNRHPATPPPPRHLHHHRHSYESADMLKDHSILETCTIYCFCQLIMTSEWFEVIPFPVYRSLFSEMYSPIFHFVAALHKARIYEHCSLYWHLSWINKLLL